MSEDKDKDVPVIPVPVKADKAEIKQDKIRDQKQDYAATSRKVTPEGDEGKKPLTPVVDPGSVVVKKRGIGSKVKDLFIAADLRSVVRYVGFEVLLPAAKNMMVDSVEQGIRRMTYGDTRSRRAPGAGASRITYHTPPQREDRGNWRDPRTSPPDRSRFPRQGRRDVFIHSHEEATNVLDEMFSRLQDYDVVTVLDYNELLGLQTSPVDAKWGWLDLRGTEVRSSRDGFYIDLPPEEPI